MDIHTYFKSKVKKRFRKLIIEHIFEMHCSFKFNIRIPCMQFEINLTEMCSSKLRILKQLLTVKFTINFVLIYEFVSALVKIFNVC